MFFVTAEKLNSNLESLHFPMFSAKCRKSKIRKRDGHRKSRNDNGKVMEKYFVKYVGILYPNQSQLLASQTGLLARVWIRNNVHGKVKE